EHESEQSEQNPGSMMYQDQRQPSDTRQTSHQPGQETDVDAALCLSREEIAHEEMALHSLLLPGEVDAVVVRREKQPGKCSPGRRMRCRIEVGKAGDRHDHRCPRHGPAELPASHRLLLDAPFTCLTGEASAFGACNSGATWYVEPRLLANNP